MARSKEYSCPNTGMSLWIDYDTKELLVRDPDEMYPIGLPIGLLVRVLEREPALRERVLRELVEPVKKE